MSQILKTFMGMFLILLMAFAAAGILSAFLSVTAAQNTHSNMIGELENSNYNPTVIEECFEIAKRDGYGLTVVFYDSHGQMRMCKSADQIPEELGSIVYARVDLTYDLTSLFLGIGGRHLLSGYAR